MTSMIQVITTTPERIDAETIAQNLIEQRLAACVQVIGPVNSVFRWRDKIETAQEWQCCAKTRKELFKLIEQAICEIHPYEVPEILAVPILVANNAYEDWLNTEIRSLTEQ